MIISGNRRIPIVYSSQKAKDQQFFKYVPEKLRVIKLSCICIPPTPPVTSAFYFYNFTNIAPPGPNYAIARSLTLIQINIIDSNNTNQSTFLNTLSTASTITYTSNTSPSNYITFTVTSASNQTSYWSYNVTILNSNGSLSSNELIKITYA
jgi:hypothetical protein